MIFAHITDELYESKIVYRTEKYEDHVRTFCMNPRGIVVNENTNGIVTVNGHSFEDEGRKTENTNFALLVSKHFSEPFHDSNGYGESIVRLSNMLGGGAIVQRFGDLERGRRSTPKRIEEGTVKPTLAATPGDLSLVLPKRILDGIIEMIYALDKIAPGTANDDTLLYGVEVKFYNMEVELNRNLETCHRGLYVIGDGSGVTHSLSHASASGVYVARQIAEILICEGRRQISISAPSARPRPRSCRSGSRGAFSRRPAFRGWGCAGDSAARTCRTSRTGPRCCAPCAGWCTSCIPACR